MSAWEMRSLTSLPAEPAPRAERACSVRCWFPICSQGIAVGLFLSSFLSLLSFCLACGHSCSCHSSRPEAGIRSVSRPAIEGLASLASPRSADDMPSVKGHRPPLSCHWSHQSRARPAPRGLRDRGCCAQQFSRTLLPSICAPAGPCPGDIIPPASPPGLALHFYYFPVETVTIFEAPRGGSDVLGIVLST